MTATKLIYLYSTVTMLLSLLFITDSADTIYLIPKTLKILSLSDYYILKILIYFLVLFSFLSVNRNYLALAVMTSPLILANFSREGFDFLTIVPCIALATNNSHLRVICIGIGLLLFYYLKEYSLLLSSILTGSLLLRNQLATFFSKPLTSISSLIILSLSLILMDLGQISNLIQQKLSLIDVARATNPDYNFFKSIVVFIISHSYFVTSSQLENIVFATLTGIPLAMYYYKAAMIKPQFYTLMIGIISYASIVLIFNTFQHARNFIPIAVFALSQSSSHVLKKIIFAHAVIKLFQIMFFAPFECLDCNYTFIGDYRY